MHTAQRALLDCAAKPCMQARAMHPQATALNHAIEEYIRLILDLNP
jgi:hypothetical protein